MTFLNKDFLCPALIKKIYDTCFRHLPSNTYIVNFIRNRIPFSFETKSTSNIMIPTAKDVLIETVDGSYILSNDSHVGNQTFQRFLVAVYDTYFKHKLDPRFSIDDFVNSKNHVEELALFTWNVWTKNGRKFLKKDNITGSWELASEHDAKISIKKKYEEKQQMVAITENQARISSLTPTAA